MLRQKMENKILQYVLHSSNNKSKLHDKKYLFSYLSELL